MTTTIPSTAKTAKADSRSMTALVTIGLCLVAGSAQAAGDGGSSALLWQGFNLALLIAVLVFVSRKGVSAFFRDRRQRITDDLDRAADLLSSAETRNSEIQRQLANLDTEIEEIRESTRRRSEDESERILAEANRSAERIKADATATVEHELIRARRELRSEAAALALELAGGIIREQVSESDRERLLDEFITRIEAGTNGHQ
jgi:F-type H+-transporting ATPase subunit b